MALADVVHEEQEPTNEVYDDGSIKALNRRIEKLKRKFLLGSFNKAFWRKILNMNVT